MVMVAQGLGLSPQPMTPYDPDVIADNLNATGVVTSIDPEDKDFFDIGTGLLTLWNKKVPFIESSLDFFQKLGAPTVIIDAVLVPWRFFWFGFVISFISGRDFMP
jgi:hypothetical protein